jgi:hypothetical protein
MKLTTKLISFLLTISSIFLLSACGVPTSKTTLKVTNSMAIGNTTYKGGLVFYGRSAGGKFFSAPIAYSAGSTNNTAEIVLDKGVWTFAAVGWSHTNTNPDPLQGTSDCAVTTVNLDADNKTVVLDLDSSKCNNDEFGGPGSYDGANGGFGITTLITCGTLYKNSSTETPLDPLNPTNNDPTYCSSGTDITPDLKLWAKSARIKIPVIKPGQPPLQSSDLSFCQVLEQGKTDPIAPSPPASTPINIMLKRLPPKGVPFIVELHDDGNCTSPIKKYELREGLKFTYPNFDHKFYNSNLYLLTTISQRGESPLMDSLPSFKCSATKPCSVIPQLTTNDRFIQPSAPFYLADETDSIKCDNLTDIEHNGFSLYPYDPNPGYSGHCETRGDRIFIKLSDSDLGDIACSSSCTLEFSFNGLANPINLSVSVQGSTTSSLAAYNLIFSSLGHEDILTTPLSTYKENGFNSITRLIEGDNEDTHYGFLSAGRELFGPQTVGGVFSSYKTAANIINTEYNLALWEDGVQKSFHFKIEANEDFIPIYLKADGDFYGSGSPSHTKFSHKLTISQIVGGVFIPQKILKWVYGKKVGILEEKNLESEDGKSKTYRRMIGWNTESIGYHRIEKYDYELESLTSAPSVITKERSSFTRAEKAGADNKVRIESFNYQSHLNGSNVYQDATKEFVSINGGYINYSKSDAWAQKGSNDLDLFNREGVELMSSEISLNHKSASALSPNKEHLINAWAECTNTVIGAPSTCTTWSINILLRSSTTPPKRIFKVSSLSSDDMPKIKVVINNGGKATIAWSTKHNTSQTSSIYAMTWNGSVWYSAQSTGLLTLTSPPGIISISGLLSLDSHGSTNMSFDLIDEDPSSTTTSTKTLVYSNYFSGAWSIYIKRFTTYWDSNTSIYSGASNVPKAPLFLNLTKNDTSTFIVSFFYQNSGDKLKSLKWNGLTATGSLSMSNVNEYSLSLGFSPQAIYTIPTSTTKQTIYFQPSDPVTKQMMKTIFTVVGTSGNHETISSLSNRRFNTNYSNYCFPQVDNVSSPPSFGVAHDTDSCEAPDSSYAPAIRSSVIIDTNDDGTPDTDIGFKHNIKSLNPATFKYLFTIP